MHNDFLSHLSIRALHPTTPKPEGDVLQPRLAGLFEPLTLALPRQPENRRDDLETMDEERETPASQRVGPIVHQQEQISATSKPVSSRRKNETSSEQISARGQWDPNLSPEKKLPANPVKPVKPLQILQSATSLTEELPKSTPSNSMPEAQPSSGGNAHQPLLSPQSQAVIPLSVHMHVPENPEVLPDLLPTRRRKMDPERIPSSAPLSEVEVDAKRNHENDAPTSKVLTVPQADIQPRLEPSRFVPDRLQQANAQPEAARPPAIHVTIGRIEVRASAQAEPPKRSTSPSPPIMSLDEYLRRRQEGKV